MERLGEVAAAALRKALAGKPSLETRRRVERLLKPLDGEEREPSADRLRLLRGVEVLERVNSAESWRLLKSLAGGAPGALVTREANEALARRARR